MWGLSGYGLAGIRAAFLAAALVLAAGAVPLARSLRQARPPAAAPAAVTTPVDVE